jgi:hypothetical protein
MKKIIIFFLIFYVAFVALMPKENLYYTLKNKLKQERVTIAEESLSDNLISLKAKDVSIFYDGIESVNADEFSVLPLIIYNKIEASNVGASQDLKSMFGFSAEFVEITYALWDYKNANILASGDFGDIEGTFDVTSGELRLVLEPSLEFEKSPMISQYFKKSEEGYIYESKIN